MLKNSIYFMMFFCSCMGLYSSEQSYVILAHKTKHCYAVPDTFNNGRTYYKATEQLKDNRILRVEYLGGRRNIMAHCTRVFFPNGERQETYRGDNGVFPEGTIVTHRLDGRKKIVNKEHGVNFIISGQDLLLALQTLKNTAKNHGKYKRYPWKRLFYNYND